MRMRLMAITLTVGAAAAVACGDNNTLPSPTPQRTLTISGRTSLEQPGETSQLGAILTLADGTTVDVTTRAAWLVGSTRVATVKAGVLTAVALGQTTVAAQYSPLNTAVPVRVAPNGLFLLRGYVKQSGFGVSLARVDVASPAGNQSTTTEPDGYYIVPAAGEVTLRVEKDGYQPEVRQLTVDRDMQADIDIQLVPAPPPVGGPFDGIWKLTVTASASCGNLPVEAMRREYTARIDQTYGLVVLLDGGGGSAALWDWGFTGTYDGKTITFKLSDDLEEDYCTLERLDATRVLGYIGTATGPASGTSIVAVFSGKVVVTTWAWPRQTLAECSANDHRLVFVR